MQPFQIPKGARVYIGAPAEPLPESVVNEVQSLVSKVAGLAEAHLPRIYFEGGEAANQVLVLVPLRRSDTQPVLDAVAPQLWNAGVKLDVWPIQTTNPLLDPVRNAHCELFVSSEKPAVEEPKPWWKFWSRT